MRIALLLPVVALASACAVVPNSAWTFDPTRPQAKPEIAPTEVAPLTDRVAQLRIELNDIRARIAAEPDARARQPLYSELHRVGRQLSPLERRLGMYASAR